MSLTQGSPLPDVTTKKTTATAGPAWYNTYLENLAKAGMGALGETAADGTFKPKTGAELVAGFDPLQTAALERSGELTGFQDYFSDAAALAEKAGQGITPELIAQYMNPYTRGFTTAEGTRVPGVVDEMERLSQQNMQRNLMPALKSFFGGTGGTGSQRMLGALGQMGADVQANLTGAQTRALADAYNKAMDVAGTQAGLYRSAAETTKGLGQADLDAAIKSITGQFDLGAKSQAQEQAKLLAPIATATGAGNIFANLKVPTTVTEDFKGPMPGAYASSPLSQIAGLGSLFAAGAGGTSAVQGITDTFKNLFGSGTDGGGAISDWLKTNVNWSPAENVDNTFGQGLGDWDG
jgi:hypothetical protein